MNESTEHLSSEILQEFLEGEIAMERVDEVESHLATCRRCASEMDAWRLLFSELDDVAGLAPTPGFAEQVMSRVSTPPSLARRLADRVRAVAKVGARHTAEHLAPERIQDYLDGALRGRGLQQATAHLDACARCRDDVREWEPLFASLEAVPRIEPSEGFSERVMHGVRAARARAAAPRPTEATDRLLEWTGRLADLGSRLVPSTGRGWAWLAAAICLPALGMVAMVGAVVAHPLLTVEGLVTFMRWRVGDGIQLAAAWLTEQMFQSSVVAWLWEMGTALSAAPALAVTALLALWALSMTAGWILYRNVVAPSPLADRHG